MVDASLVLDAIVAVSIAAGALFAVAELRALGRDRRTQLVMSVWQTFISPEFAEAHARIEDADAKDLKDLMKKCSRADLVRVGYFYEGLGLLVERQLVDPELALEISYPRIMWTKLKPAIDDWMQKLSPLAAEHFAYLARLDTEYKTRRLAKLKPM